MPPVAMQTAQDLLRFREPGKTAELVRGVLIVREPPGTGHGARAARLTLRVGTFVERHDLGRSEEHTSELQSLRHLVCRLLLEKKKKKDNENNTNETLQRHNTK